MRKFDDQGASDLAPIIIFSVLFLALTLAVIPQMIDVFYSNAANGGDNTAIGYDTIGGHQYSMWETTIAGTDTNWSVNGLVTEWIDWQNVGLDLSYGGTATNNRDMKLNTRLHFSFYEKGDPGHPDRHRLDVWVVRNNTNYAGVDPVSGYNGPDQLSSTNPFKQARGMRDFFFFREYAWSGAIWENTHNYYDVGSFVDILSPSHRVEDNTNMTTFNVLGKYNITFFAGVTPASALTLENATLHNHFLIQVGSDLMNLQSRSRVGMWNIVGGLFMFHSEDLGMPDWLNWFISTILWICVGFAVVGLISRFIPTIPGL